MASETEILALIDAFANRPVPGKGLSNLVGRLIPSSLRPKARVVATRAIGPMARRKAHRLAGGGDAKLNIGCGTLALDGWINIDLVGLPVDVPWDLRQALPFRDGSAAAVFHEHVIEHVPVSVGYRFLKECHRVLKPGGVLRVVAPDASRYMSSYFDPAHGFIREFRGERPTPMMALQEEFYGFGHRAVYDYDTIREFCEAIGFSCVEQRSFGDSRLEPCPDSEWRIVDSFYTEAVK